MFCDFVKLKNIVSLKINELQTLHLYQKYRFFESGDENRKKNN